MVKAKNVELLMNAEALQEVNRHRWLESEKAGMEIDFDLAAVDWLNRFSDGWIAYHKLAVKTAPRLVLKRPKVKINRKTNT